MSATTRAEVARSASGDAFGRFLAELGRAFRKTPLARLRIRRTRRLRLRETLSLGERRLVAIVECDEREFLVGATGQTISLLARLGDAAAAPSNASFEEEPALTRAAQAGS
ncbi:MAG: flagellar biosynthetic protein FliO [Acidobacteriota bacterium]|nr:flagellar biosynthetic protein FliO [Acidobacteriota bacterium]